jgi:hypothetical protein
MIEPPPCSPQRAPQQTGLSLDQASTDLAIFKAIAVNADAHRIFRALTLPEYLEAWICIPGAAPDSLTLASPEVNGYRLNHFSGHRASLSISGSFLFCHLRKIRLFWRKTANASSAKSVVDFRVRGNFARSVLELRHTEFGTAEELAWYETLWRRSLENLSSLLRGA